MHEVLQIILVVGAFWLAATIIGLLLLARQFGGRE